MHRAFSVFLVNSKGEILIQKRAQDKYHSPGLWANACCSHPRSGEDVISSAESRMQEELGCSCKLKELFNFVYLNKFNDNLYEYEIDHVLLGYYDGPINLDPTEASEYMWISPESLAKDLVQNPTKYSSWFIICAPRVIKLI